VKAASVLKGFLNKNHADRLGCHRETGFLDIVNHPFFKSIDWEMVSGSYISVLFYLIFHIQKFKFIENKY
jgi:atypical protein kinase C iota type